MNSNEIGEHLQRVLVSPNFLNGRIAGAEVPYFICPYPPSQHVAMLEVAPRLAQYLTLNGIPTLHVDLYALCVDCFREQGVWQDILDQEHDLPKDALGSTLTNLLGNGAALISMLNARMAGHETKILLLSNIGACYPFLRAHAVLNHLFALTHTGPVVMFFPGTYGPNAQNTMALNLFGTLNDNHYYRALNLLTIK